MRNPTLVSVARPALTALAVFISLSIHAADRTSSANADGSTTSLLDQLFSPPAPLRDSTVATVDAREPAHGITISGMDNGSRWQFAVNPQAFGSTSAVTTGFTNQIAELRGGTTASGLSREQQSMLQSFNNLVTNADVISSIEGNGPFTQWLTNAAQYAGTLQINATAPLDESLLAQTPTETIIAAINSPDVTRHLEKHNDSANALAQLLGWQKTGLLPSATDLQKMASSRVGAVTSSIERWALNNVSFSATSHTIAGNETQEPAMQWQWTLTNRNQYTTSNSVADNEANFGANLRRLFGMNDYY